MSIFFEVNRKMNKKFWVRFCSVALCAIMMLGFIPTSSRVEAAELSELSEDIIILYTNDIHTYIDKSLSYDVIAAIKAELQTKYKYVYLVDAGDHIQGTAYGSMDKGKTMIELMNAAGYDIATLGNHEFDYAMQGCLNAIEWAKFTYISCNFYREENGVRGENVLQSYVMLDCGSEKLAFVGITTPETFSKSTPAYFQDENGNYIYGIAGGDDGSLLYADVQRAIDEARADGATKVVALGHLGVDPSSAPYTSEETIAAVSGLDAFIDGHSHTTIEGKNVTDKNGSDVLLTQTGEYFDCIGIMRIDAESGSITTDLIEYDSQSGSLSSDIYSSDTVISNADVKAKVDSFMSEIDGKLGETIGSADVVLDNYDSDGDRLVRKQETNSGDFSADALYYLFDNMGLDVDIAIMNGGGIRNRALTGSITYKDCKDMQPFGNVACLVTVKGQQILDMLEWGSRYIGVQESGDFLHVAGLKYKIDMSVPNTTVSDDKGVWVSGPEKYRVSDVTVYNKDTDSWEPLKLDGEYNLAGYNYTLRDLGGGFAMLSDGVNVVDYVMEDYMTLANYISAFENGCVKADNSPLLAKYPAMQIDYSNIVGDGRITIVDSSVGDDTPDSPETGDAIVVYIGLIAVMLVGATGATFALRKKEL